MIPTGFTESLPASRKDPFLKEFDAAYRDRITFKVAQDSRHIGVEIGRDFRAQDRTSVFGAEYYMDGEHV